MTFAVIISSVKLYGEHDKIIKQLSSQKHRHHCPTSLNVFRVQLSYVGGVRNVTVCFHEEAVFLGTLTHERCDFCSCVAPMNHAKHSIVHVQ